MQEIEVGEYVRTENGFIDKIIKIDDYGSNEAWLVGERFLKTDEGGYYGKTTDQDIIKHSKNIIDLIEVGDYVNGEEVIRLGADKENHKHIKAGSELLYNDEIKSVLTKEQFNSMEYRLED